MKKKWCSSGLIMPSAWKDVVHARIDGLYEKGGHKGLLMCAMLIETLSRSDEELRMMIARIAFVERVHQDRFLQSWEEGAKLLRSLAPEIQAPPTKRKPRPVETA